MELEHRYGPALHVLHEPFLLSLLARIGAPETRTADLPPLCRAAYARLTHAVLDACFPVEEARVATRMAATEPRGFYQGPRLSQTTRLVICAVIRAGLLPAQTCYETACQVLPGENVRLDYLNMSRETDAAGRVTGVRIDGSKIGGPIDDAVVLIPDPMGATGGTITRAVETYRALGGRPRAVVAMHLMVTPEAVRNVLGSCPEVTVYTGRLDRGLSPDEVLATPPGTHPERERGLNEVHYIVPGAGGMGELLTNSWV
jgi:uracil phosphoribosyltransferase